MKKLCILFLLLMLPLQGLMAEKQFFHVFDKSHAQGDSYSHSHSPSLDDHHHHGHSHGDSEAAEADHHHHCPGHCVVMPPSLPSNAQPELKYAEYSLVPVLATSSPSSRIERPNWC